MDDCVAVAVAEAVAVAVTEAVAEADQSIHDQSIHDPSIHPRSIHKQWIARAGWRSATVEGGGGGRVGGPKSWDREGGGWGEGVVSGGARNTKKKNTNTFNLH